MCGVAHASDLARQLCHIQAQTLGCYPSVAGATDRVARRCDLNRSGCNVLRGSYAIAGGKQQPPYETTLFCTPRGCPEDCEWPPDAVQRCSSLPRVRSITPDCPFAVPLQPCCYLLVLLSLSSSIEGCDHSCNKSITVCVKLPDN